MKSAITGILQCNPLFGAHANQQKTGCPPRKRVHMDTQDEENAQSKPIETALDEEGDESESDTETQLQQQLKAAIAASKLKKERKKQEVLACI